MNLSNLKACESIEQTEQFIADYSVEMLANKLAPDVDISGDGIPETVSVPANQFFQASKAFHVRPSQLPRNVAELQRELDKATTAIAYQIANEASSDLIFVSIAPELPKGVHMKANAQEKGLFLRMVSAYDVVFDQFMMRLDVLYAFVPKSKVKAA